MKNEQIAAIALILLATVFVSGCVSVPALDTAKTDEKIKVFLSEYQDATSEMIILSKNAANADHDYNNNCAQPAENSYTKVVFSDPVTGDTAIAFVDSEAGKVICSFIGGKSPAKKQCGEEWSCTSWLPSNCPASRQQKRSCVDVNSCGTVANKPAEMQECDYSCTESWNCTEWSQCPSGTKTRVCTDSNNCKTTANKPAESQPCSAATCVENWTCSSWSSCTNNIQTRKCTDSKNCGTTKAKPTEQQACSVTPAQENFTGSPSFEGDSLYMFVNVNASIRTTDKKYIIVLKEINSANSCATFDIFKKYSQDYKKIGSANACKNLPGQIAGEDFVILLSEIDAPNKRAIGVALSGNFVLSNTTIDYPDTGIAMFVKEGQNIELNDGVYNYILQAFQVGENSTIKIFRKSLINGAYEFKGFIPIGESGGSITSNTQYEISLVTAGFDLTKKTIGTIQFSKMKPGNPDDSGTLVEGTNILVTKGARLKKGDYIVDLADVNADKNSAIFKAYVNIFGGYHFTGAILALEGVVSSSSSNQIAVKASYINFPQGLVLEITLDKTFYSIPTYNSDGNYANVKIGESIQASNGYILKVVGVEYRKTQIVVYNEIGGQKFFVGAIPAVDNAISRNTYIPVSVQIADSNAETGTISSIQVTSIG